MQSIHEELNLHTKVKDITLHNDMITCEVDRIQSVARGIINRIACIYLDEFKITSTTKGVNNIGYTKITLKRG